MYVRESVLCVYMCVYVCVSLCACACLYTVCFHICVCVCVYMCVCVSVCVSVCVFVLLRGCMRVARIRPHVLVCLILSVRLLRKNVCLFECFR